MALRFLGIMAAAITVAVGLPLAISLFFFPMTPRSIGVHIGKTIFQQRCASCHSIDAGRTGSGPSLYGVGSWAGTRREGMDTEEYIFSSIVRPGEYRAPGAIGDMPENIAQGLTTDELISLTAFLCAQGGKIRMSHLVELIHDQPKNRNSLRLVVHLSSVERGKELFFGKLACGRCHSLEHYPGYDMLAPSLLGIGYRDRDELRGKILQPSGKIKEGYESWQVVKNDIVHSGRRLKGAPGEIKLLNLGSSGGLEVKTFKEDELDLFEDGRFAAPSKTSIMPTPDRMDNEELEALLDFLYTLR